MFLAIRMVLYFLFPLVASQGLAVWDEEAGTLTFHIESLVPAIVGFLGFIGTFIASRFASKR